MPTPRFLEGCPSVWAWSVDARLALLLLGLGMALATAPVEAAGGTMMGSGIMVLVAWCSALAGVLNEWLIKKSNNVLEAGRLWLERPSRGERVALSLRHARSLGPAALECLRRGVLERDARRSWPGGLSQGLWLTVALERALVWVGRGVQVNA